MVEGSETTEWELHFVVFFADIDVIRGLSSNGTGTYAKGF